MLMDQPTFTPALEAHGVSAAGTQGGQGLFHPFGESLQDFRRQSERPSAKQIDNPEGRITSKYTGVIWARKANRWRSTIKHKGRKVFLGTFQDEILAARAFDKAAIRLRGPDTRTNFPHSDYADMAEPVSTEDPAPPQKGKGRIRSDGSADPKAHKRTPKRQNAAEPNQALEAVRKAITEAYNRPMQDFMQVHPGDTAEEVLKRQLMAVEWVKSKAQEKSPITLSANESMENVSTGQNAALKELSGSKRGPGRPKGSKNKPKPPDEGKGASELILNAEPVKAPVQDVLVHEQNGTVAKKRKSDLSHKSSENLDKHPAGPEKFTNKSNKPPKRGKYVAEGGVRYKGVTWQSDKKKWRCQLGLGNSKKLHIGYFDNPEIAARAFDKNALKHLGPNANTNYPISDYLGSKELFGCMSAIEQMAHNAHGTVRENRDTRENGGNPGDAWGSGAVWHPESGQWEAVGADKSTHLGLYATQEEAVQAHDKYIKIQAHQQQQGQSSHAAIAHTSLAGEERNVDKKKRNVGKMPQRAQEVQSLPEVYSMPPTMYSLPLSLEGLQIPNIHGMFLEHFGSNAFRYPILDQSQQQLDHHQAYASLNLQGMAATSGVKQKMEDPRPGAKSNREKISNFATDMNHVGPLLQEQQHYFPHGDNYAETAAPIFGAYMMGHDPTGLIPVPGGAVKSDHLYHDGQEGVFSMQPWPTTYWPR